MAFAITISRQMGSLGCDVAREAAQRLGYRMVWRELINQAAIRAGAPEAALSTIDELGLLGIKPSAAQQRAYIVAVARVLEELVVEGQVVIVGRAGQVILRERPGVLHVQVIAPFALRVERIAQRRKIGVEAASAQVETSDHYRRNYLMHFYHVRWEDPLLYDLTVNTAHLSVDQAAGCICQAMKDLWLKMDLPT